MLLQSTTILVGKPQEINRGCKLQLTGNGIEEFSYVLSIYYKDKTVLIYVFYM